MTVHLPPLSVRLERVKMALAEIGRNNPEPYIHRNSWGRRAIGMPSLNDDMQMAWRVHTVVCWGSDLYCYACFERAQPSRHSTPFSSRENCLRSRMPSLDCGITRPP